ncbi:sensor histidine kinase [Nonomuraea candida]|uniref:sensor histidine kinase n=1 Tax=Nonomuraea candida TaxID=359159 RepID=UPI000694CD02|nr:histidine kinase [Nonomuraea candida]
MRERLPRPGRAGAPWRLSPGPAGAVPVVVVLAAELGLAHWGLGVKVVLLALAGAALMPLRRRHPVVVAVLVTLLYAAGTRPPEYDAPVSAMLIALYSVGRHAPGRVSLVVGALSVPAGVLLAGLSLTGPMPAVLAVVLTPALPVAAGHIVRLRVELAHRREQLAAEIAVREERRRIARELHDVIAHHVSVIGLYMGVARRTIPIDPERARDTLLTGEDTARRAMAEMRHLLDVLRADGEPVADQSGAGVARLPALVAESGDAALEVEGTAVELPTTVDHAVYRIVQESLTNTRKHAAGARSRVRLAYRPGLVEVEVSDDGRTRPGAAGTVAGGTVAGGAVAGGVRAGAGAGGVGMGLGLAGMAERVSLCGGELRAGPAPEGGFVVHARIPLPEAK